MPYRFINVDVALLALNVTSVTTMAFAYFSDHLTGIGGFLVMLSVAYLNFAKAQKAKAETKQIKDGE